MRIAARFAAEATSLKLAGRLAGRELRGGLQGFRIFLASLALGVAAIAAVGSVSSAILEGLRANAQLLLGGDVEVRVSGRALEGPAETYLAAHSVALARLREMRAIAVHPAGGQRTLVELKGVAASYPLFGEVVLDPPMALETALARQAGRWGAAVEASLLDRLGAALGDTLAVGDALYEIRARIVSEPDRVAGAFSLGPRLMVAAPAFDATGLVRAGSLIRHLYRVRLAPGEDVARWLAALHESFPDHGWRLRDSRNAQPRIKRFVDRFGVFLTLVGVTALLVGGMGVGNAVQNYMAGKRDSIAILKWLGAPGGLIFRVYVLHIAVMAVLGIGGGLVLGALAPGLVNLVLEDRLGVAAAVGLYPAPLVRAALFGLLVAFLFALWPLARAREVPAAALFRDVVAPARRLPRAPYCVAVGLGAVALAVLAVYASGDPSSAAWFALGAAGSLLAFRAAAALLVRGIAAVGRPRRAGWRLAFANICRPGAPTAAIVVSLGAGLTVLVAVALIEDNLARQVSERIPARAPAFFFIDIQPDQADAFDATVDAVAGAGSVERVPMLRGRLAAVNGVPVARRAIAEGTRWVAHHEIGLTYLRTPPPRAKLMAGRWWPPDYAGPALVSLDADVASGLAVGVGDSLTLNVLGREITARIANLRKIDWLDIGINFMVVFAPGTLEAAPQTHLATAHATPAAEAALFRAVNRPLRQRLADPRARRGGNRFSHAAADRRGGAAGVPAHACGRRLRLGRGGRRGPSPARLRCGHSQGAGRDARRRAAGVSARIRHPRPRGGAHRGGLRHSRGVDHGDRSDARAMGVRARRRGTHGGGGCRADRRVRFSRHLASAWPQGGAGFEDSVIGCRRARAWRRASFWFSLILRPSVPI